MTKACADQTVTADTRVVRLAIVAPVFNDWESFQELCLGIDRCTFPSNAEIFVFAVDDGSSEPPGDFSALARNLTQIDGIEILQLTCNLGHQRAIAAGLSDVFSRGGFDFVIVMDGDGEDRPADIERLIDAAKRHENAIVVAQRAERSEGRVFRALYSLYKAAFVLLTGKSIDFGNFCLIPSGLLGRIIHMSESWNHLAGTIVKSRMPLRRVETPRGHRYAGESKMNLVALVLHGLGAISVFSETVFVRVLITSIGLSALAGAIAAIVVGVRLLTDWAIPGWASVVLGLMLVILFQALSFSAGVAFLQLNGRAHVSIIPALDAGKFIQRHTSVHQKCQNSNSPTSAAS